MRLYFISFGEAMKQPERYGFRQEQIAKIDIAAERRVKMLAFRAHRSQSEVNAELWDPDEQVVRRFGSSEYFIQAHTPFASGLTDLFAHVR
jgi:LmbE family N-acetylglucosaminyl deacetylase